MQLGVNISNDPKQAAADCALAAHLGAKWIRVSIEQSNSHAMSDLATIVQAAHNAGLHAFETCQPIGHVQPRTQAQQDAYAAHVAQASTIADATGRDNESNGYGSNETPDPRACAESMVACIEARNARARGRTLVTDELCPGSKPVGTPRGQGFVDPFLFFQAMMNAEPSILHAPHLWVGWHGYGGFGYPAGEPQHWNTCWMQRQLAADIDARIGKALTIASTEFGSPTGPAGFTDKRTYAQQADDFDSYMTEAHAQHKVGVRHGPWIWYTLRDRTPQNDGDWAAQIGLVDIHGQAKPVAARFTAHAAA